MIDPEMSNRRGPLKTPEDWKPEPITLSSSSAKKRSGLKSGGGRIGKQHGGGGGGSRSSRRGAAKSEVAGQSEPACEMFESFRNLEDAMAMAKMQSLESSMSDYSNNNAKATTTTTTTTEQPDLIQSFRNLDMALAQAQHNSLGDVDEDAAYEDYDNDDDDDDDDCYNFNDHHDGNYFNANDNNGNYFNNNNNDNNNDNDNGNGNNFFDTACGDDDRRRKGTVIMESFRDLDEATALAIQNSLLLNERDKNLFRSCRNMDMPNNVDDDDRMLMMMNNNNSNNNTTTTTRSAMEQGMFESFRNLDSAMSRAKHASLKPGGMEEHDENGNVVVAVVTGMDDNNNGTSSSSNDYEHQQHLRGSNGNMSASDRTETSLFESFVNLDDAMAMAIKLSINDGMEDYDGFGQDELFDNDGGRKLGRLAECEDDDNNNDDTTVRSGTDRMLDQKQRVRRATLDNANAVDSSSQSFNPRVEHVSRPAPNLSRLARRHADRRLAQDRAANNNNNNGGGGGGGSSALQHGSTESNNNNEGATTTPTTTTTTTTSATSGASNNNGTEGGSGTDRRSEGGTRIRRRRSRRSSSQGNVISSSASDASLGGASDHSRGSSGSSADAFERRASLDRRASFSAMRRSGRSVAEGNGGGRDEDVGGGNRFRRSSTESTDATPPAPIIPNKEEQHDVKNLHYNRGRGADFSEEHILGDNLNPVQRAKKKKGKGRIGTLLGSLK